MVRLTMAIREKKYKLKIVVGTAMTGHLLQSFIIIRKEVDVLVTADVRINFIELSKSIQVSHLSFVI